MNDASRSTQNARNARWMAPRLAAGIAIGVALWMLMSNPGRPAGHAPAMLPPNGDAKYGIGAPPTPGRLADWDSDIGPDGAELPEGRGTVAEGAVLYRAQCASCHGANGEGVPPLYPQLVGRPAAAEDFGFGDDGKLPKTIGNYWPHATSLYDYIRRAMPMLSPGSLTNDQTYALTAYLLAANDVIADSATLDAVALRAVRMPARDRFVPDDRAGSRVVR